METFKTIMFAIISVILIIAIIYIFIDLIGFVLLFIAVVTLISATGTAILYVVQKIRGKW